MKKILLLTSFTIATTVAMAQWIVQAQYNLWIPTSQYNSDLKLGLLGVGVEAKYVVDDHLRATIGANYALFNYKTVRVDKVKRDAEGFSDNAKLQIIPITLGADVFFSKGKFSPYLDMDFGAALVKSSGDNLPERDMDVNAFISPGFGIEYEVSDNLKLNGVVKQQVLIYNYDDRVKYLETFTAVGINLGFTYKF